MGEAIEDQAAVNLLRRWRPFRKLKNGDAYMYHNYIAALLLVGRKNGSAENGSILGRHDSIWERIHSGNYIIRKTLQNHHMAAPS
ncbi:MAG: hypothetical protein ACLTER_26230 [Ruminococcus sp.]